MSTSLKIAIAAGVLALGGVAVYLDVQLNRTQDNAAAVAAERDQAKATASQLSTKVDQLQETAAQLSAANVRESMPELPVNVTFHHALLGHSMVADFHSHASTDIAIVVDVMDAATHGHRRFEIGVGPNSGGTHVGPLERVRFEPGDMLTLTHDGYKPVSAQVP